MSDDLDGHPGLVFCGLQISWDSKQDYCKEVIES